MPRAPQPLDEAIRNRILLATGELMAEHGVAGATQARIATRAGIAYGSLYRYFPDRNALLLEAFSLQVAEVEQQWRDAEAEADPVERLANLCWGAVGPVASSPGRRSTYTAVIHGAGTIDGAVERAARAARLHRRALLRGVRQAKRAGYFRGLGEESLVTMLMGITTTYLSEIFVPDEPDWARTERDVRRLIRTLAEAGP